MAAFRGLCVLALGIAAGASTAADSVTLGARVYLGPLQVPASNLAYEALSGDVVDLNGDGAPDIVLGFQNSPVIYLNNRTATPFQGVQGRFVGQQPASTTASTTFGQAFVADVDGDGRPDLATAGFHAPNMIYLNDGTASPFKSGKGIAIGAGDTAPGMAFGDVNNDGFPDLLVASTDHLPSRLYLTHGKPLTSGGYTSVEIGTDLGYGSDAKIADVNADGRPDLILAYSLGNASDPSGVVVYLNDGSATPFATANPIRLLSGRGIVSLRVADLNGDGRPEIVVSASRDLITSGELILLTNTGSATAPFSSSQFLLPDPHLIGGCLSIAVGDLNQDGRPDLLVGCTPPNFREPASPHPTLGAIYLNNGTAAPFARVLPIDIPVAPNGKDFDFVRGLALGTFVKGGPLDMLIVDNDFTQTGQSGIAGYAPVNVNPAPAAALSVANGANVHAIVSDGQPAQTGGLDHHGYALPGALLGNSLLSASGSTYSLLAADTLDGVWGATLTPSPAQTASALKLLGVASNGSQLDQPITLTYSDQSVQTISQSFSDWGAPKNFAGESIATTLGYRVTPTGARQAGAWRLYSYFIPLDPSRTLQQIALPSNRNVVILAANLESAAASSVVADPVQLQPQLNAWGIRNADTDPNGGLDGHGYTYAAALLGNDITWSGIPFQMPLVKDYGISVMSGTVGLPTGYWSKAYFLATGFNGPQLNKPLVVTYSDGSTQTVTQNFSDWGANQHFAGEGVALTMPYRIRPDGTQQAGKWNLYAYSLALDPAKIAVSIKLSGNVRLLALTLAP